MENDVKRKNPDGAEYPANWKEIAQAVKEAASWKCVRCGHRHDPEAGYTLTVHHLDIDCRNCAWWNIPALCQRCHLHIQGKVVMERPYMFAHSEWFLPYVAAYYGVRSGALPETKDYYESLLLVPREQVMKRLDEFLQPIGG
jgi:DNA-directed RNA polymerase subunit RPC12/RpoP